MGIENLGENLWEESAEIMRILNCIVEFQGLLVLAGSLFYGFGLRGLQNHEGYGDGNINQNDNS